MKISKHKILIPLVLVVMLSVYAASGQSTRTPPNSAPNSPNSDIRANSAVPSSELKVPSRKNAETRNLEHETRNSAAACMATAADLEKTRILVSEIEIENKLLAERLEIEQRTTALLGELNETRKSESEALRTTVATKNETIAAKDAVIASQDKLIETLKRKKTSIWRRLGDVLIGAAAIAVLK